MRVRLSGDTAVVTYRTTTKGVVGGKSVSRRFLNTEVFVRRGGQWQLLAAHYSRLPE